MLWLDEKKNVHNYAPSETEITSTPLHLPEIAILKKEKKTSSIDEKIVGIPETSWLSKVGSKSY